MTTDSASEFAALVAGVHLENVRQLIGTFSAPSGDLPDTPHELSIGYEFKYELQGSLLLVYVRLKADVVEDGAEGEPKAEPKIKFLAVFELIYKLPDQRFSDETLRRFAANNGVFNAWPYGREFVQQSSVRAGLPPIVLPAFRVPASGVVLRSEKPPAMPKISAD